jgi:hypothetical protein
MFENHGIKVTAELPWDSDFDQVFSSIRGQLVCLGWAESMIDDYFIEKGRELDDYKNPKKDEDETEN